jgi:hypothetical protein
MTKINDNEVIGLCNEAIANIRLGYLQSACLIMDEALRLNRLRRNTYTFDQLIDSFQASLKGENNVIPITG